jgi:transcriptional regulator with XRE-family HTH domain
LIIYPLYTASTEAFATMARDGIRALTALGDRRQEKGLSQLDLAAKLQSRQSRVAKMEAGDPSVSLDLLIRSLISLGASERELSQIITTPRAA